MPQPVLAGLVGRTEDWLSKIENDRAKLDRLSVIRALADALGVSVSDLIGEPTPKARHAEPAGLNEVRSALMDYRQLSPLLSTIEAEGEAPRLDQLRRDVAQVMDAYQQSKYSEVLRSLPLLLTESRIATSEYSGDEQRTANRMAALASQSAAMILTKLGQPDLAWIAAQRGLTSAESSEDSAVVGSLLRSVIHTLHTNGRPADAAKMTRTAADFLRRALDPSAHKIVSIYGTLLLPGAVAAARAGDRAAAADYLDEAEEMAALVGTDGNLLWTAFGPTNVRIHRVTTAMALGDIQIALDLIPTIDARGLPPERQVRHAIEVASALHASNRIEDAIDQLLVAERQAPEQIHEHVMSRQLVLKLRATSKGKRSKSLASLARRMKIL